MSNFLISPLVAQQLPEFVRSEYDTFVTFLQKYYEWMEQSGNVIKATEQLSDSVDIDTASDYYVDLIKQDLLNNTLISNPKYHNWINTHRNNIFYKDFVNSYEFDVENNPQKYLKSMIYMHAIIINKIKQDDITVDNKSIISKDIKEYMENKACLLDLEKCKIRIKNLLLKVKNNDKFTY